MNTTRAANKVIFLIAPPRSLSTAFLRMMGERNDFKIINEPACGVFNQMHYPQSQTVYSEQTLTTYSEVKTKILSAAKDHPIFIKEMSFSFEEFITAEPDLMNDPNIYFAFLLRNPHHGIISYYKKMPANILNYIIGDLALLTGYRALYTSYKLIQENAIHAPYILHAEHLYQDTINTITAFCKHINMPYNEEHLTWNSLDEHFTGFTEWQENKKREHTHHWHHEALRSQGFHQPTLYDVDQHHNPTFNEIKNKEHQNKCREVYQESKTYYDLIR
jgi:hypothetical protein